VANGIQTVNFTPSTFSVQVEREKKLGEDIMAHFESIKSDRGLLDTHLQEISEVIIPNSKGFNSTETPGKKLMERVFDNTPIWANEQLAGAVHGMLVNPFQRWFQLKMTNKPLNEERAVKLWLDEVEDIIYAVFADPVANFNSQSHSLFLELAAFGTSPMLIQPTPGISPGIRYTALPLRQTYVLEGGDGTIDTAFIQLIMTVKQAIETYGEKNVSESMRKKGLKQPFSKVDIVVAIMPRILRDITRIDNINKPWASTHVEMDTKHVVKESGFDFFPMLVPRWTKRSGETYGRSPGMTALPDANMLNEQMRTHLRAMQKIVDPPLLVPDDGYLLPIRTAPSSLNFFRTGQSKDDRIHPLITNANWQASNLELDSTRERILRAFFLDRFRLQKEKIEMTRAEAVIRKEEDLQQLSPTVGRLETEFLNPLIDKTFTTLQKAGRIPPPPPEITKNDAIGIEYVSAIARAQKADESNAVLRSIEVLTPIIQAQPDILDNFNGDEIARATEKWFGTPVKLYNSRDEVQQMRDQRQQANFENQGREDTLLTSEVAKNMEQARPS